MSEASRRDAVRKKLPLDKLHWQPMTGGMNSNGTPDTYVCGPTRDAWFEWKELDAMPRDGIVCVAPKDGVKKQPKGRCTELQMRWIERRYIRGANAFVVAFLPNKLALVFSGVDQLRYGLPVTRAVSTDEVAKWICSFCL